MTNLNETNCYHIVEKSRDVNQKGGEKMRKLSVVLLVVLLTACAARNKDLFTEKLIETSKKSSKPAWVFKTFKETKNGYEFSGGVTEVSDYALGISEARAEAIKNGIVSIQIKVRTEFTKFASGANMSQDVAGKWVGDGIAFVVESLYVSGIKQKEVYYEKAKYNTEYKPHYNIWVLCSISSIEYLKAKIDAAQKLVNKYQQEKNEEAKEKAEELLDQLREEQTA